MALVIGYAISPLDLIPDFIPVLELLDDLVIVPAGIALVVKMIPKEVMEECRRRAKDERVTTRTKWLVGFNHWFNLGDRHLLRDMIYPTTHLLVLGWTITFRKTKSVKMHRIESDND